MIARLLIANRGEIACRIIATCRRLGIETVAVYSDADAGAKHVREADLAIRIGPPPAADSYLNIPTLIEAAKATGADAVHPGYGFLSEVADFAAAVQAAGLIWVGPRAETIQALGPKDAAKSLAEAAGVPILPGYRDADNTLDKLRAEAELVGYPLLIKAVAGGGGRGIREVSNADALEAALKSAQQEALSAFGNDQVMLEKLIGRPRHIEVQVFGDGAGEAVHLYERDCSLQRRRQKVIEEAPAPNMPERVRTAMCAAAVALAKSVQYAGAGTVEFIIDGDRPLSEDNFFFLEMNTRLQVEHPVTEAITGFDLVEWQLRIASGEGLPATQDQIHMTGHAIEVRLCAEDPSKRFMPGAGLIETFSIVTDIDHRLDSGFEDGDRVPPFYDSMIAKLIVHADDRAAAIDKIGFALDGTQLIGVPSNAGFLRRCVASDAFGAGTHDVTWLEQGDGVAMTKRPDGLREAALSVAVEWQLRGGEAEASDPWAVRDGWRLNQAAIQHAPVSLDDFSEWRTPTPLPSNLPPPVMTLLSDRRFAITVAGDSFLVTVPDYAADAEALAGGDTVAAPMPGKLLRILTKPGSFVARGDTLALLEAMKMEHALPSPRDGTVETISASEGDQVSEGDVLIALVPEG